MMSKLHKSIACDSNGHQRYEKSVPVNNHLLVHSNIPHKREIFQNTSLHVGRPYIACIKQTF